MHGKVNDALIVDCEVSPPCRQVPVPWVGVQLIRGGLDGCIPFTADAPQFQGLCYCVCSLTEMAYQNGALVNVIGSLPCFDRPGHISTFTAFATDHSYCIFVLLFLRTGHMCFTLS